jgi:hypothetical protein
MLNAAIALRSLVVTGGGGEGGTTMTRFRNHDDEHLRRAIELAREARTRGNVPFGSVLVNLTGKPKNLNRTLRKERRVWSKDTGTCPE